MVLVDTDVLVWILRDREDIAVSFKSTGETAEGFLYITPLQVAEIFTRMLENEELSTKEFLESFIPISLDYTIGETAGLYMNQFGKSHGLTLADALIASAARKNALKLWTLYSKHYPMLEADDFWKPER